MNDKKRTAVVTGGSSGIGLGVVQGYLERGWNVVATSRTIDKARMQAAGLPDSPRLRVVAGDVGEAATARKVVDEALEAFGSLDVLVNNAGVFISKPFTDYTAEDVERLLATNVHGFLHLTQLAVARMREQGGGSVITVTASIAEQPIAGVPAAVPILTKAGLNAATKALALEYATENIRFNAVSPGIIETPMYGPEAHGFLRGLQPVGRMGRVEDVVDAVMYLTDAPFVTGEILHVDGAMTAGRW
ncbi:MAG TPA: SDR family oxidoreductase [Holophagaceae bacterium]|nr:SDR family oxidoreductase [Holophagaceae bacterium]